MTTKFKDLAPPRTRWGIVALAVAAGVFVAFQVGKMPASLPPLMHDLHLTAVQAGWAVSMLNAFTCLFGIAIGALADVLGARRLIIGGLVVTAASSIAGSYAGGSTLLLLSRFGEGLGAVAAFVATPSIILRAIDPGDMRLAMGIWSGYMPLGQSAMVLATPILLLPFGWRGVWLGVAVLLIAFAAVFAIGTAPVPDPPVRGRTRLGQLGADIGSVLAARGVWLLALCFLTYTSNFLSVTTFLPTFLVETQDYAIDVAAALTACVIFGNVLGNVLGGWLLQRGAPRWLLIMLASLVMGGASLLVYRDATPDAARIALAFAFSFFGGLLPASVFTGVPQHAPSPALIATTNGMIMQCTYLGMLLSPPAFAALAASYGWSSAPLMTAASSALGVAAAILIGRHEASMRR